MHSIRCGCGRPADIGEPRWDSDTLLFSCKRCGKEYDVKFAWVRSCRAEYIYYPIFRSFYPMVWAPIEITRKYA